MWLDQAMLAIELKNTRGGDTQVVAMGKLAAFNFFFAHELPHVSAWLSPILNDSQTLVLAEEYF